jgi:hypothetical protein
VEEERMNDGHSHPGDPVDPSSGEGDLARTVCFQVSRLSLLYRYLVLLVLTGIGTLLLSLLIPMAVSGRDYLIGGLLALWGLALLRYWVFLLSMPHRICIQHGGALVFHSLFRARKIDCAQIAAFRVSPIYQSYLKIVTSGKKSFPVLNHVDGLHDLIARIKRFNPNLRTRGC